MRCSAVHHHRCVSLCTANRFSCYATTHFRSRVELFANAAQSKYFYSINPHPQQRLRGRMLGVQRENIRSKLKYNFAYLLIRRCFNLLLDCPQNQLPRANYNYQRSTFLYKILAFMRAFIV